MEKAWENLIRHENHEIDYNGLKVFVRDGVFTPDSNLTYSTAQTLEYLKTLPVKGKEIMDMGCGTGIIGMSCLASDAARVTFSDINPKAIENTLLNLKENNFFDRAEVVQSDLFEKIDKKFDFIFANLPIDNEVWSPEIKEKTETLVERFLEKVPSFMKEKGRAVINWGSFASSQDFKNVLEKFNYKYHTIQTDKLGHTWYIIDIQFD